MVARKLKECRNEGCNALLYWNDDEHTYFDDATDEKHKCQYWKPDPIYNTKTTTSNKPTTKPQSTGFPMENLDSKLLKIIEVLERISLQLSKIQESTEKTAIYTKRYAVTLETETNTETGSINSPMQDENEDIFEE